MQKSRTVMSKMAGDFGHYESYNLLYRKHWDSFKRNISI